MLKNEASVPSRHAEEEASGSLSCWVTKHLRG